VADALKQRLIRRVLHQGMFEQIRRLGRNTPSLEQLRLDELAQALLQGSVCHQLHSICLSMYNGAA
jgi:hypothetical protein